MIPFKLFKYLYVRDIIYIFCCSFLIGFVNGFVIGFLSAFVNNIDEIVKKYNIIIMLIYILCMVYACIFTFKRVIFKKYKSIEIITDVKHTDWKVILILYGSRLVNLLIISSLMNLIFGNIILVVFFSTIITIIPDYYISNYILSKYINIKIINEVENKDI